ncbi:hypothetical protein ABZP36_001751 [Zizania latifolia]
MDHLPLVAASASGQGKVLDAYKKALTTAASVAAYMVLARSMARELLPDELRGAARWCAAFVGARLAGAEKERHTVVIRREVDGGYYESFENDMFDAARTYLATKIDPRAMRRLSLMRTRTRSRGKEPDSVKSWSTLMCMEPGDSTTDVFEGVEFKWSSIEIGGDDGKNGRGGHRGPRESLELSFDAEHTDMALERYIPFVTDTAEQLRNQDRALRIYMNESRSWHGFNHHHPATFDTLAMAPELKQSIIDDLERFLKRKDYYSRIGKAWKRGYLLYGPPGTGKSSLVAAMANYLRFNLYDLDLSEVHLNSSLQKLLINMPNKSILVIEDIDCCFDTKVREDGNTAAPPEPPAVDYMPEFDDDGSPRKVFFAASGSLKPHQQELQQHQKITLSGLLNFIDGLWSTSGEERIIVFTTNYKDRLDPALLRPGRMDLHIYMGYCGWDAFKTLAHNYFLIDDHPMFPDIQKLLAAVDVTPAEVSEMLLRSEEADVALGGLMEFLAKYNARRKKINSVVE